MIERTLVLLKPDSVKRSVCGQIITRLENAGLKIVAMKMQWIDVDFSKKHYSTHISKAFYNFLENFIQDVALLLRGVAADIASTRYEYFRWLMLFCQQQIGEV